MSLMVDLCVLFKLRREVEMLLANKSQLALDNAYLTRERERLLQLVGYFQTGLPSVDSD